MNKRHPAPSPAHSSHGAGSEMLPVIRITPHRGWLDTGLAELFTTRDLLFVFIQRIVGVQYKQTILGLSWAVLNPIVSTVVFTIIFGRLAGLPSNGLPYPLFALSAMVMWQYFSRSVSGGSGSLVASAHIIGKVYFPRMILPISHLVAALVDLAVNFVVLLVLMVLYQRLPGLHILFMPFFLVLLMLFTLGVSLAFAALNALYRDITHIVPFLLQIGMYLTPVIYPIDLVPATWRWLLYLNPVTSLVQGVRWSLFPDAVVMDWGGLAIGMSVMIVTLVCGIAIFRAIEPVVVDNV